MRTATIVFKTDYNHTHESKERIGVFSNKEEAIAGLKRQYIITKEQIQNLRNINQTQTYSYEEPKYTGEFILEECPLSEI